MAKKPKKSDWVEESDFPPPLNAGESAEDQEIAETWVKYIQNEEPIMGLLTITQPNGYCEFIIDEADANKLIQQLRQFIAGDSDDAAGNE